MLSINNVMQDKNMYVHIIILNLFGLLLQSVLGDEYNITITDTVSSETPNRMLFSHNEITKTNETENATEICNSSSLSCYWKRKHLLKHDKLINFKELENLVNYAVKISIDDSNLPLANSQIIAKKLVNECKRTEANTHGEKAVKMRNCMFEKLLRQRNEQADREDFEDIPYLDIKEEACVVELSLDGPTIEDINRYYIVLENNTEFNKFLACLWKKEDMMDEKGNFNISVLLQKLDEIIKYEILARSRVIYLSDIITESIMDHCKDIKGEDDEELVKNIQNYVLNRIPYFKFVI